MILTVRDELRTALEEALTAAEITEAVVLDHVPEEIAPPALILEPAEDYLSGAETFADEYDLNLELYVLVDLVGNQQAAEDLDQLLGVVLALLRGSRWGIKRMSAPAPFHTTQWLAHGCRLSLSTETTL